MSDARSAMEIRTPDGHVYRIHVSGEVEGFGDGVMILNRIPALINQAVCLDRERRQTVCDHCGEMVEHGR